MDPSLEKSFCLQWHHTDSVNMNSLCHYNNFKSLNVTSPSFIVDPKKELVCIQAACEIIKSKSEVTTCWNQEWVPFPKWWTSVVPYPSCSLMHLAILQVTDVNNYVILKHLKTEKTLLFGGWEFFYKTDRIMSSVDIPSSPAPSRQSWMAWDLKYNSG